MFKSVFTKFIALFMLILFLSFVVLTTILSSLVNGYNTDVKLNDMSNAAYSVSAYIIREYQDSVSESFDDYLYTEGSRLMPVIDLLSFNVDRMSLYVVASDGQIVFMTQKAPNSGEDGDVRAQPKVPASVFSKIREEGSISDTDTLDGFYNRKHCSCAVACSSQDGTFLGAVIASTDAKGMGELLKAMNKSVLMSTLWIMLAALLAVYFITERMVEPLREMSRAATKFAKGQFDARVPVVGNDEIADLAQSFNSMAQSMTVIDETQRTFVANVSHDLRTPMTTISGFVDGIRTGVIPPEKQDYYLGLISDEVHRLSRLVVTLLDISRMQAGERKFKMERFDVCELARQVLISFEQKIEAKNLEVEFLCDEDSMFVEADRDAIHQVLYNICDNAIKFAYEGGKYELSLTSKDKKVEISVFDEGIGIDDQDLPHIFDRFYKSDKSRGLDKSGTGLGMFISRTIIEAHGETIRAESEYGKWCRFTFTLKEVG